MTRPHSHESSTDAAQRPSSPAADPRVGATPDLVVLREADLDQDLASAIDAIRTDTDPDRAQARILVVAREEDSPPKKESTPTTEPRQSGANRPQAKTLGLAQRLHLSVDCLRQFLQEADKVVASMDPESASADFMAQATTLREIHDWSREVVAELATTVQDELAGPVAVDLYELTRSAAAEITGQFQGLHLSQSTDPTVGDAPPARCFADSLALEAALRDALELVALRIGGRGGIAVQLGREDATTLKVRILGLGEPGHQLGASDREAFAQRLEELRLRFARAFGGWLWHDILGPGGTGLVVHLPAARR